MSTYKINNSEQKNAEFLHEIYKSHMFIFILYSFVLNMLWQQVCGTRKNKDEMAKVYECQEKRNEIKTMINQQMIDFVWFLFVLLMVPNGSTPLNIVQEKAQR